MALVVTSLLLGIVTNGAVSARERQRLALKKRDAVYLARQLLTTAAESPFEAHQTLGTEGQLSWKLIEAPLAVDPRGRFALAEVKVEVSDSKGLELFAASTRRLKAVYLQ